MLLKIDDFNSKEDYVVYLHSVIEELTNIKSRYDQLYLLTSNGDCSYYGGYIEVNNLKGTGADEVNVIGDIEYDVDINDICNKTWHFIADIQSKINQVNEILINLKSEEV